MFDENRNQLNRTETNENLIKLPVIRIGIEIMTFELPHLVNIALCALFAPTLRSSISRSFMLARTLRSCSAIIVLFEFLFIVPLGVAIGIAESIMRLL